MLLCSPKTSAAPSKRPVLLGSAIKQPSTPPFAPHRSHPKPPSYPRAPHAVVRGRAAVAVGRRGPVAMPPVLVHLGVDAAAEDEGGERVVVGEEHQGLHQLGQRPAVLPCLQQSLQSTQGWRDLPDPPTAPHSWGEPRAGRQGGVWDVRAGWSPATEGSSHPFPIHRDQHRPCTPAQRDPEMPSALNR